MTLPVHHDTATDLTVELFGLDDITLIVTCCDSYQEIVLPMTLQVWSEPDEALDPAGHQTSCQITLRATYKPRHLKQVHWQDLDVAVMKYAIERYLWHRGWTGAKLRPKTRSLQFEGMFQFHARIA